MQSLRSRSSGMKSLSVGVEPGPTAAWVVGAPPAATTPAGPAAPNVTTASTRPTRRTRNCTSPVYHRGLAAPLRRSTFPSDRPRRRLRSAVRTADRTPGPRAERLLRDRPAPHVGGGDGRQAA